MWRGMQYGHIAEQHADNLLDQHLLVWSDGVGTSDLVHGRENVECDACT